MQLKAMAERVELWPLDRLVPYDRNPRTHSDEQIDQIAASMVEFGFTNPLLIDSDDGIIAGHGRLEAAKRLGLTEVPVIVLDHLSPAQRRAYLLADNRLALNAGWDDALLAHELHALNGDGFDLSVTGFSDEELAALMAPLDDEDEAGGVTEDEVPEPPETPVTRPGDLWLIGKHRLLCGDSTNPVDVRRVMTGERAILFATDPPYLVDYDGTNHPSGKSDTAARKAIRNKDWSGTYGTTWDDASQGPDLYRGFIRAAIDEALEPNAAWYSWHASRRQAMLEAVWDEFGAFVHQQIIWVKNRGVLTRSFYLWRHEPCFYGWIKGNKPPRVTEEMLSSVWEIDQAGEDKPDHPTPKPLKCFAIPMLQHVELGGLCYEPFSGSGSQIIAGEQLGRRVYAIEITPAYVDVAVMRWQNATGKEAVLEGGQRRYSAVAEKRFGNVVGT